MFTKYSNTYSAIVDKKKQTFSFLRCLFHVVDVIFVLYLVVSLYMSCLPVIIEFNHQIQCRRYICSVLGCKFVYVMSACHY